MTVFADDLIAPVGPLTEDLLTAIKPGADALTTANAYLSAGEDRVQTWTDTGRQDRGAIAWAAYRALTDRAQQILAGAMSVSATGDGSESFSTSQAIELRKDAALHLAVFEAEAAAEAAAVNTPPAPAPALVSRQSVASFTW